jgi:hypothetical protein
MLRDTKFNVAAIQFSEQTDFWNSAGSISSCSCVRTNAVIVQSTTKSPQGDAPISLNLANRGDPIDGNSRANGVLVEGRDTPCGD